MNASTAKIISPAALRCVLGLTAVFAPMVVAAMERPASHRPGPAPIVKLLAEITAKPKPKPTTMELVWKGADIDGDGASDFANPTGAAPRGHGASPAR